MIIRKANENDVDYLFELNELFNGKNCTTKKQIAASIAVNTQEDVFVAELDNKVVGFCCIQIFKSMCYNANYAEVTELFVKQEYRRQGVASALIAYIEAYLKNQSITAVQLFTGKDNINAQSFYEKAGYKKSDEIMYRKR